ncbi:MAG: ABC transporter ATP-binding protein/permease [Puniceicoccales bacterium]|jgi:subfamily B ATP-binding cassette protein MsbA|nr:ABC transporter ATP-binding protein/permease [Puniceicoccales bacterium]
MKARTASNPSLWQRSCSLFSYFRYLRELRRQLFFAIACGILCGLSSGFGVPFILKVAAKYVFTAAHQSPLCILLFCACPFLMMGLRGISGFCSAYYTGFCGQRLLENIRVQVFAKIQRLPLEFFHKTSAGEIISRAMNDTALLQGALLDIAENILTQPITFLASVGALLYLCLQQSQVFVLILYAAAFPLIILPVRALNRRLRFKAGQVQGEAATLTERLSRNLSAVQEIRAFCMEQRETARFAEACRLFSRASLQSLKYNILVSPIIEIIAAVGVSLSMYFSYRHRIPIDTFIALTGALYFSYDPIKKLGWLATRIQTGFAGLSRIQSLLEIPESIQNPKSPVPIRELRGEVHFQHISFGYTPEQTVIHDLDWRLETGKIYALVGSSGAGKTTLINLLMRFYDVRQGKICIDGLDIRELALEDLRAHMAFVPQNPTLLSGSIGDNIRWGKWEASEEEVIAAAQSAHAHEFICQLEQGYRTDIGENGNFLSGGQRQRIALARAFLKQAPILVLDEVTSALDAHSEHAIQQAIRQLVRNKTVLIISHRLGMMAIVDEILVLRHGHMTERGTHDELMTHPGGLYRELYRKHQGILNHPSRLC